MSIDFSHWEREELSIAQGCLTNSKHPYSHVFGIYPTHVKKSYKSQIITPDGDKYLDYICGLGTNLLGYGNEYIKRAVTPYYDQGACPSLPHVLEYEAAEAVLTLLPSYDRVKFQKTGSEACNASIKIARAYTGRDIVLSSGYHGHGDEFTTLTPPAKGCVQRDYIFPLDEHKIDDRVACVIIEPVIYDYKPETIKYLQSLRNQCDKYGVLLIYDEVITGLRFKQYSVTRETRVKPDMVILGKALGNGHAISCIVGNKDVMDSDYFVSSTYAGEIYSLAACIEVIRLLKATETYKIERLWEDGARFIDRFNELSSIIKLRAYPTRGRFMGSDIDLALFFQEMARANILMGPSFFYNFHHPDYDDETIEICRNVLERLSNKEIKLKGKMPIKPFSQKQRSDK